MINRKYIISSLYDAFKNDDRIHAMWLEGADANNMLDDYSDINICVRVDAGFDTGIFLLTEKCLSAISDIDHRHTEEDTDPAVRRCLYHLAGSHEYLMIDLFVRLHSSDAEQLRFISGSAFRPVKVLFDKTDCIRFVPYNKADYSAAHGLLIDEYLHRYSQHGRVKKYLMRGDFLEAYSCYIRYVFEPLVGLLRIIYTPESASGSLLQISHQIPEQALSRLARFVKIGSIQDIFDLIPHAEEWFCELLKQIRETE